MRKGWDPVNRFNHASWVTLVSPTDRHKPVSIRYVIEVFGHVCMLPRSILEFSVGVGLFVIKLNQNFPFLLIPLYSKADQCPWQ